MTELRSANVPERCVLTAVLILDTQRVARGARIAACWKSPLRSAIPSPVRPLCRALGVEARLQSSINVDLKWFVRSVLVLSGVSLRLRSRSAT